MRSQHFLSALIRSPQWLQNLTNNQANTSAKTMRVTPPTNHAYLIYDVTNEYLICPQSFSGSAAADLSLHAALTKKRKILK